MRCTYPPQNTIIYGNARNKFQPRIRPTNLPGLLRGLCKNPRISLPIRSKRPVKPRRRGCAGAFATLPRHYYVTSRAPSVPWSAAPPFLSKSKGPQAAGGGFRPYIPRPALISGARPVESALGGHAREARREYESGPRGTGEKVNGQESRQREVITQCRDATCECNAKLGALVITSAALESRRPLVSALLNSRKVNHGAPSTFFPSVPAFSFQRTR